MNMLGCLRVDFGMDFIRIYNGAARMNYGGVYGVFMGLLGSLLGGWTDYQGFCRRFVGVYWTLQVYHWGRNAEFFTRFFWRSGMDGLIFDGFSGYDRFLVDFWLNFGQIFKFDNSLCLFPYYVFFSGGGRV